MEQERLEVYILMLKALEEGPFADVGRALRGELENSIKEFRLDYLGERHNIDLKTLLAKYPNITSRTLFNFCKNLKHQVDLSMPTTLKGISSYLAAGQLSLLRTPELLHKEDVQHSSECLLSTKLYRPAYQNHSINMFKHLQARKLRGPVSIRRSLPVEVYAKSFLYRKVMGHLSSVYCVCFDQSGQFVFTGADDHLIKIWSARDGRLIRTLRGHDGEITDMSVNFENRLLASGGMDRVIRIWDLKTSKLLDCLNAHHAMVTSVKFAPYNRHGDDRYLISTSNDGTVIFWTYHVEKFEFKKLKKFQERNRPGGRIVCSSFSSGGSFLACGSSDNYIHVYGFHPTHGPYWLCELSNHKNQVDSIQFSNHGFRFITGSQDGTAKIWNYKRGSWSPLTLDMKTQLDKPFSNQLPPEDRGDGPRVLIVQWSLDDRFVMTSIVDYSIKVWDSKTGQLVHILKGHEHDVYLIESHPKDPRIFLSASHDGTMILWDLETGKILKKFQNRVNQGDAQPERSLASIYDIKFSPDGTMIAATDSYGYLSLYGYGSNEAYKQIPEQMFFHTDYRALIRDIRHFVMDEQTHVAPHLMPKPTLVDMNGNPYPHHLQKLVPEMDGNPVIEPLSETQINLIGERLANHSKQEDDEYLNENRSPPDDLVRVSSFLNAGSSSSNRVDNSSRYNTRYSTRDSFRSARTTFRGRPRRARPAVRYNYNEEEEEEDQVRGHLRRRRVPPQQRIQPAPTSSDDDDDHDREEEDHDDEETDVDDDDSTEIDESTEADDDATEVDTDATEIVNPSPPAARPVRRCSARIRNRKRMRFS